MNSQGWTLIELLFVLSIITILTALSLPQPDYSSRLSSGQQLRQLAEGIALAKAEAVLLGQPVTVCGMKIADNIECAPHWTAGFSIMTAEKLLDQHPWQLNGQLQWQGFSGRQDLRVDERGMLRYQNGSFTYCPFDQDMTKAQQLIVNAAGRTRLAKDHDQDGIRETSHGTPITCHQ